MEHPWLSIRMLVASTVLFAAYAGLFFLFFTIGGWAVGIVCLSVLLTLQYIVGIKFIKWRMDPRPIPQSEYPELHELADELANQMEITRPPLYFRDDVPMNAAAMGRRGNGIVLLSPSLLNEMTEDEVECILAHEFAHLRNRDHLLTVFGVTLASIISGALLISSWVIAKESESPFWVSLFGVIISSASHLILMLFVRVISRHREYVADFDAIRFTDKPNAMRSALNKLRLFQNQQEVAVSGMTVEAMSFIGGQRGMLGHLLSTHPSIEKRIEKVDSYSNQ